MKSFSIGESIKKSISRNRRIPLFIGKQWMLQVNQVRWFIKALERYINFEVFNWSKLWVSGLKYTANRYKSYKRPPTNDNGSALERKPAISQCLRFFLSADRWARRIRLDTNRPLDSSLVFVKVCILSQVLGRLEFGLSSFQTMSCLAHCVLWNTGGVQRARLL